MFPKYLVPDPQLKSLAWLAGRLKQTRGDKPLEDVARAAKVGMDEIREIEKGRFNLNLGRLRDIVTLGYSVSLADLLADFYAENRDRFDRQRKRLFKRDFHYSICRKPSKDRDATPFFIGGDLERYVWAIPLRELNRQPLVTELLELAPYRKKDPSGITPSNAHNGVEVIIVMHGCIDVRIEGGPEGPIGRRLEAGDAIHFHASHSHRIENAEKSTSALLFIVRLPEVNETLT